MKISAGLASFSDSSMTLAVLSLGEERCSHSYWRKMILGSGWSSERTIVSRRSVFAQWAYGQLGRVWSGFLCFVPAEGRHVRVYLGFRRFLHSRLYISKHLAADCGIAYSICPFAFAKILRTPIRRGRVMRLRLGQSGKQGGLAGLR